jgi:hypothetical protein
MPRSKKPRKAYRPQPVHANSLDIALNNVRKLSRADVQMQTGIFDTALRQFSAGQHCAQHWRSLADTANMAETLAGMGICSGLQAVAVIDTAQRALAAVRQRHTERNTWTLYATELDALQWLASLHARQLVECDYSEFERAFQGTRNRIGEARRGNAPRGAIVIEGDLSDCMPGGQRAQVFTTP